MCTCTTQDFGQCTRYACKQLAEPQSPVLHPLVTYHCQRHSAPCFGSRPAHCWLAQRSDRPSMTCFASLYHQHPIGYRTQSLHEGEHWHTTDMRRPTNQGSCSLLTDVALAPFAAQKVSSPHCLFNGWHALSSNLTAQEMKGLGRATMKTIRHEEWVHHVQAWAHNKCGQALAPVWQQS